jgi:transposase-like protein
MDETEKPALNKHSGGGRKPKFKPVFIGIARKACERGFTDREVADLLGINASTLYRWRVEYPHFARAIRLGKEMADVRVERSLYERAVGYSYEAQKAVVTRHGQEILRWREHLAPDVTAALAYLRNRRPDRWRDTIKQEHSRSPYDGIESAPELRAVLREQARKLGLVDHPVVEPTPARKTEPVGSETPQIPTDPNIT